MASRSDSAGSVRPRSRRSIAHVPRSKLTSGIDKENSTTDIAAMQPHGAPAKPPGKDKKSRSKSLGPGGLDALQELSNGNRRKSTTAFPLKGILKPTVPVSPVRNIPSFEETRKATPARGSQPKEAKSQDKEGLLIDLDTPAGPSGSGNEDMTNPFDDFNASSAIAAAREQEEKEQRERERKAAIEKRDARRKSLANRRVSFAPEATLHTWNVVEIPDDSTSSSTSNSTRRASSTPNTEKKEPEPVPDQSEFPSSPTDAEVDSDIAFSPVQYPDLQSLANRPAPSDYGHAGDSHDLSSSPFSGSDASEDTGVQSVARDDDDDDEDEDSVSDAGFDAESTAMSMDDMTAQSSATARTDGSDASTSSSTRLNEALRQAAQEAGTKGIDHDENDDVSMEMASQEITGAFQPWIKKGQRQSFDWDDLSAVHDQENVDPSQPPNQDHAPHEPTDDGGDEEMSMDVTNAIGGILSKQPNRRQSTVPRQSTGAETSYDDQTMEFTNVVGGIAPQASPAKSIDADDDANEDEEMTMEFTSVVGGVMHKTTPASRPDDDDIQSESHTPKGERNFSEWGNEEDDAEEGMEMEMTGAIGGTLPPIEERTEPQDDDQTAGMDVTTAMGKILPSEVGNDGKDQGKSTENEFDFDQPASSPFQEDIRQSPAKSPSSFRIAPIAAENGSPSLASVRSRPRRSSLGRATSTTPTPNLSQPSPAEEQSTPSKQPTPKLNDPSTPEKTPPSAFRGASPQKLFEPELQGSASQYKSPRKGIFEHNAVTGQSTPQFILRPNKRRSSGLGIDKEGIGSPRVAAMLDKRRSIGEEIPQFVPQDQPKQGVRFEDPLKLQEEVDREREEEENREDGHIPPLQPNERDATSSLRDMISSLTPKKDKIRGRKSLHVGTAKGLLGKRPKELDEDEDEEESDTPKRLRGPEASPVKPIKLPPPSMDDTVGRSTRSPAPLSPTKGSTTPTQEPKSGPMAMSPVKDASISFNSTSESQATEEDVAAREEPEEKIEPIQLQDFLNMTNIHFMELTTTKRRHTTVPGSASKKSTRRSSGFEAKPASFEDCVAAGFCTVPMLELYQHSCRELKSYISEGRQVIRSIEAETYAENPPLFQEYVTAPPDIRSLMDNQFRNVKTHARLLSKATWYEWRMRLLEGLKEGLNRHADEMKADGDILSKYEALLNGIVPTLVEKNASLEQEATTLQQLADEMENCDQDELRTARDNLVNVEDEIASKKRELEEMQNEVQEKTNIVEAGTELKTEFLAQIQEAERVKEECRGWSAREINELKDSVREIEHQTGWSIIAATSASSGSTAGPSLSMSYRSQLQLMFYPAAFYTGPANKKPESESTNMPLELRYHPGDAKKPTPFIHLTPIASLVLKSLQNHLTTIHQPTTAPKHMLRFISEAWDLVLDLEEETRMLEFCGVTKLKLLEVQDKPALRARCTLLGTSSSTTAGKASKKTPTKAKNTTTATSETRRIDIDFAVRTRIFPQKQEDGDNAPAGSGEIGTMDVETDVIASKIYGFGTGNTAGLSEDQMREILSREIGHKKSTTGGSGGGVQLGNGVWSRAVRMLTGTVF